MSTRKMIVHLHHSASSKDTPLTELERWHKERGFCCIGYHFVIQNGVVHKTRDVRRQPASIEHHNKNAIAICVMGNYDELEWDDDWNLAVELVQHICMIFDVEKIVGHRELAATDCPGLNIDLDRFRSLV